VIVGIIVDGRAEADALQALLRKAVGPRRCLRPRYADMQPTASPEQIAKRATDRVRMLRRHGADRIILLIDREDREDCCPALAAEIERALAGVGAQDVHVVVKDRAFENWLVADPEALAALAGRFRITKAFRSAVAPDKADAVHSAAALLSRACLGKPYNKRRDPARIVEAMDVVAAARNSRSLRRFLRLVGSSAYRGQSRRP